MQKPCPSRRIPLNVLICSVLQAKVACCAVVILVGKRPKLPFLAVGSAAGYSIFSRARAVLVTPPTRSVVSTSRI